jgi:hypothetical protein
MNLVQKSMVSGTAERELRAWRSVRYETVNGLWIEGAFATRMEILLPSNFPKASSAICPIFRQYVAVMSGQTRKDILVHSAYRKSIVLCSLRELLTVNSTQTQRSESLSLPQDAQRRTSFQ